MTSIPCGTWPVYGRTGTLEYDHSATRASDFKQVWRRGIHLIGSTRAYADFFTHLQADAVIPPLRDGGSVLDYGIGTVAFSLALTNVRVQINGMDINPFLYASPSSSFRRAGVNVQVFHGEARQLPFAPASFDLVVSPQHLLQQDHGLAEIWRVLQPGSPVIVMVNRSDRFPSNDPASLIERMQHSGFGAVRLYNLSDRHSSVDPIELACVGFRARR